MLPVATLPQGRLSPKWLKWWDSCTNNSGESAVWSTIQALAGQVKTLTEMKDRTTSSDPAFPPHIQNPSGPPAAPRSYASVAAVPPAQVRMPPEDYRKIVCEELRELEEQGKRRNSLIIRDLEPHLLMRLFRNLKCSQCISLDRKSPFLMWQGSHLSLIFSEGKSLKDQTPLSDPF